MRHKYIDVPACLQVLGRIYQQPDILDDDNYVFMPEDFVEDIHKVLFKAIYNLHAQGVETISLNTIEDYLQPFEKQLAIYNTYKGGEILEKLKDHVQLASFDFYYHRMRKMTLLRMYHEEAGLDLNWLYDPENILDLKKKEIQEEWFNNATEQDIVDKVNDKLNGILDKYACEDMKNPYYTAGTGIKELLEKMRNMSETGYPLYGKINNTIVRGARLKKFYLRSAESGLGKSRSMIADVCTIGCDELYDIDKMRWIRNGVAEPVLYISTEQELEEIQSMMLAFISGVNEAHILYNEMDEEEEKRLQKAEEILERCTNIIIKELPDFSLSDVERTIRNGVRKYNIKYVFYDYIHSSIKILSEVAGRAGVKGLREDNVLFMMSVKLKDLCNELGIFLMSATQLSNDYHTASVFDQGLLQGAKAIANKVDVGEIMLYATDEDKKMLESLCESAHLEMPSIKISVYKNRRGVYNRLFIWCKEDRGTCRIIPLFCTRYDYTLLEVPELDIQLEGRESAF